MAARDACMKQKMKARLEALPDDILVEILSRLEVGEIIRLRTLCMRLNHVTRLRSLWSDLARNQVIAKNLPWPVYSSPIAFLPTSTLELLTTRALVLHASWDLGLKRKQPSVRKLPFNIGGLITWLEIVRSRWLVFSVENDRIELWDLEDPLRAVPNATYPLPGYDVERSVVVDRGAEGVVLILSCTLNRSLLFNLRLLYPAETVHGFHRLDFRLLKEINGFRDILDANNQAMAFGWGLNVNDPYIVNYSAGVVRLSSSPKHRETESSLAIQLQDQVIAVAMEYHVELYHQSDVAKTLMESNAEETPLSVRPFQCIQNPSKLMVYSATFLEPGHPPGLSFPSTRCGKMFVLGIFGLNNTFSLWTLTREECPEGEDVGAEASRYSWTQHQGSRKEMKDGYNMQVRWGQHGQYLAYIGGNRIDFGLRAFRLPEGMASGSNSRRAGSSTTEWTISSSIGKTMGGPCAFDEYTGVLAAAWATGEICVIDAPGLGYLNTEPS